MKIVKYFILVTAIVLSSSCEKKSSKEILIKFPIGQKVGHYS